MGNVVKANFNKREALVMKCTACGAAGVAGCDCGAPYERAGVIAKKANAANPQKSVRKIASESGVSRETVRRARNSSGDTNVSDVEGLTARAKAAVVADPKKSNVAIGKQIGCSEMTVRRARAALDEPVKADPVKADPVKAEPRKPSKPPANTADAIKQASAFHVELYESIDDFCTRLEGWFEQIKELPDPAFQTLYNALESNSMRLQRLAQKLDGR
jgi:hypothetical protein